MQYLPQKLASFFSSPIVSPFVNAAQPADPLAQLKDIHLPAEPGFWPLAIGWWFALLLMMTIAVIATYLFISYKRRNRYRNFALALLDKIQQDYSHDSTESTRASLQAVAQLIKRTAQAAGAAPVSTQGDEWINWLNQSTSKPSFSKESCELLSRGQYQPLIEQNLAPLFAQTRHWIKNHKLSAKKNAKQLTKQELNHV